MKVPEIVLILTVEVICVRKSKILRLCLEQEAALAPRMLWKSWMLAWSIVSWKMKHLLARGGTPSWRYRGACFIVQR